MYRFRFLGKDNAKNTQYVSAIAYTLIEVDYRERGTVVCVPIRPVAVPMQPDTVQIWSVTVLIRSVAGSSGKKGLSALCSVLPPASRFGVICCNATRAILSVLSHTLYNHKDPLQ